MLKVGENNEQRGGIRKLGEIRMFSSDAFLLPTWRKQLGPFRRPLLGAGRQKRKEERFPPVGSREGSSWSPLFCLSFLLFIPGREVSRAGDSSYLCLCDLCKPGYALLNGTEGRGGPSSQSPLARGRTQRKVVCSSMFYPVSTHTCTLCTEQRLTWGFLGL